jgi:hypothetical protein
MDMKKLLVIVMMVGSMALTFTSCGGGDKGYTSVNGTAVPNKVLDKFYKSYPAAHDVKWDSDNGIYKVKFEVSNEDMKATYTMDGDLIEIGS